MILKTCPFCGKLPVIQEYDHYKKPEYVVFCVGTNCPMEDVVTHRETTQDGAVKAWNTRSDR